MSFPTSKISPAGNYRQQPNQAYISTKPFNGALYSYSTYVDSNFVTQGTLAAHASYSTTANSPAGRVLHVNGRTLNTGVNPGITKFYVGVLDSVTGQNGYIDPTVATWAKYDVNLPVQYDLGDKAVVPALGGQGAKLQVGPVAPFARFTADATNTSTAVTDVQVTAGQIVNGMTIFGAGVLAAQTISAYTLGGTTLTLSANASATTNNADYIATSHGTSGSPLNATAGVVICDGTTTTTVYNSYATVGSLIILTQCNGSAGAAGAGVTVIPSNGSFAVTATADSAFNYLIIN